MQGEYNSKNNTNPDFNCTVKLNTICSPANYIKVLQKTLGNTIYRNMLKCSTGRCKFQFIFYPSDKVVRSVTKTMYDCVNTIIKYISKL